MTSNREGKWLILSDLHAPFHDEPVFKKVLKLARDIQPDGFILNGDVLDLWSLGSFNADSVELLRDVTLEGEYKTGNSLLDRIDDVIGSRPEKIFLYGNHEDRYRRELERGDRGKYAGALRSPSDALALTRRGYTVLDNYKQHFVRLGGHLEITHGIYATVHAAKRHLDEFQGSVIIGHTHRLQSFVTGKRGAWNCGFLGDSDSPGFFYVARSQREKWSQSFCIVTIKDGAFWVEPIQVNMGTFVYGGKAY
jgi:predicted phosphodiesterase